MNLLFGISLLLISMFFFPATYALYKEISTYLPNTVIIFFQNFFSWLIIAPWVAMKGMQFLHTQKFGYLFSRSICGLISFYCISKALETISLAEVVLLNNSAPLFIPLIIWAWHKTKISAKLWLSLIVGFIGISIILRPGWGHLHLGLFLAAFSGFSSAMLLVLTRHFAQESFLKILFYYFLIIFVASSPFLFTHWENPPFHIWMYLVVAGVTMILAQLFFTASLRYASSHELAPFLYSSVIFSGLLDWYFWDTRPDWISLVGMVIVCAGGVMALMFSKQR